MLVNGRWSGDWQPIQKTDDQGQFVRQTSGFRNWITPDGSAGPTGDGGFKAEPGRYRLYVALICPWASRALMTLQLKNLTELIPVTVVNPILGDQGWRFGSYPGADEDPIFEYSYVHQLYTRADPDHTGRATVPVLWDQRLNALVNNESADIVRMFDTAFEALTDSSVRLYPRQIAAEIDALNKRIYAKLNNGVYRAGFAVSQTAHDQAVQEVFEMLDELEDSLNDEYLFGATITESDIRLFVTLIRFDAAYHGLFKTNRKRIADYPNLSAYMKRMLALTDVRKTVNFDHITRGYYSIKALNPSCIRPGLPDHIARLL